MSDEVDDIVQREGGGAIPASDEVGRLLVKPRAGLGSDAGGVWRLLGRTLALPDVTGRSMFRVVVIYM